MRHRRTGPPVPLLLFDSVTDDANVLGAVFFSVLCLWVFFFGQATKTFAQLAVNQFVQIILQFRNILYYIYGWFMTRHWERTGRNDFLQ